MAIHCEDIRLRLRILKSLKLPDRRSRLRKKVHRLWGIRLGTNASAAYANRPHVPQCMSPAVRESSTREVLGFLCAHGQFGFPASMKLTHASDFARRDIEVGKLRGVIAKGSNLS